MLDTDLISTIVGILGGIGILVAGVGYAYSTWKNGGNKYKEELIKDLKETVAQRDCTIEQLNQEKTNLITSHQTQITDLVKQLARLQAQFDEQSKKLELYNQLLENRDPTTLNLLTEIKTGIETLNKHQIFQEKNVKVVAEKAETVRTDLKAKKVRVIVHG